MRNRSISTACLYLALALCPAVALGGSTPVSVGVPQSPSATALDGGVELRWGVVDFGGGVSQFEDLILCGAVAVLSDEPFAILRGFDSPGPPETGAPVEGLLETPITEFALAPISPNPNRGVARVSWSLPAESRVRLSVHDIQGREIQVLADGPYPPGRHEVIWRAGERAGENAGVYFVRLQTAGRVLVRRMAVVR